MDFSFNDEQREIQESAKRLMAETASLDRVVELSETESGWDPDEYKHLAELGWTGLHVPEEHGGVGLGHIELVVVLEQMGGSLYPSPFFASVCLAGTALIEAAAAGGLSDENAELLAAIAAGERTAALAYSEPGSRSPTDIGVIAKADGGDLVLSGVKNYVIDGGTADALIVTATDAAGGVMLVSVPADAAGVTRSAAHAVDATRKLATIELSDVRVPASAALGEPGGGQQLLATTLQLGAVALAAESLGAAQHCFDTALAYTKDRHQFGRPIASFQAVKHICADLLMAVEASRSATYYAAWVAAEQREELAVVAPLAKAQVSEAFWEAARANIQLHGGIGFTYEHEAHHYYRRATASRVLLGDTAWNREMLLQGLGAAPVA
jgi:alkylation response protein AidB-like acyl-CoA dehydrogenase